MKGGAIGWFALAWQSAWNRRFGLGIVALSVALSSFLLLGLERIRQDVRLQFSQSVSGTDLIVGARTGSVQLLLYSVFRMGNATQNIRWSSAQAIAADPAVAWTIPISLGDSHRNFPVVGTTGDYFRHFQYGERQALDLAQGRPFAAVFETVLGAEVAQQLGYRLGERITLSHGSGAFSANDHGDMPFEVVGILARTGTPVDRSVHIGLDGMEAIHLDWMAGVRLPGQAVTPEQALQQDLAPRSITALLVGLKSRTAIFGLQRSVGQFRGEPLMAILPGVALDELWHAVGLSERVLMLMGALVAVVSLAGLVAVVVTGLEQRRRELAVLRAVGASPGHLFSLLVLEGALVTLLGALLGVLAWVLAIWGGGSWLQARFGLDLQLVWGLKESGLLAAMVTAGCLASVLPGWRAYRLSLADGLQPRQ
jgi:putative ABC transport system permease protein